MFKSNGYQLLSHVSTQIPIVCLSAFHKDRVQRESGIANEVHVIGLTACAMTSSAPRLRGRATASSTSRRPTDRSGGCWNCFPCCAHDCRMPSSTYSVTGAEAYTHAGQGVFLQARLSHSAVADQLLRSDAWLYLPDRFCETYCLNALEAQRAGCICFVSALGSLPEVVGPRGIVFPPGMDTVENVVETVVTTLQSPAVKEELRERLLEWMKQQTWEESVRKWARILSRRRV